MVRDMMSGEEDSRNEKRVWVGTARKKCSKNLISIGVKNLIPDCVCKARPKRKDEYLGAIKKVINESAVPACVALKLFSLPIYRGIE